METGAKNPFYLAVAPDRLSTGDTPPFPLILLAARLEDGGKLVFSPAGPPPAGCLLGITESGFDGRGDCTRFCQEIARALNGFDGAVCLFEGAAGPFYRQAIPLLDAHCARHSLALWVPESLAGLAPHGRVMISSALSGGTLRRRLSDARERYGGQLVLFLERAAMEFPLPAPMGTGRPLSPEALDTLLTRGPAVFFSPELCARYFVCFAPDGAPRFVLFDDAGTFREKYRIAREFSLSCAALHTQMDDWLIQQQGPGGSLPRPL